MKSVIEIANEIMKKDIPICTRCLGRVFGKLGHNLDNPTRGTIIKMLIKVFEYLNDNQELLESYNINKSELNDIFQAFSFQEISLKPFRDLFEHVELHEKSDNEKPEEAQGDTEAQQLINLVQPLLKNEDILKDFREILEPTQEHEASTEFCLICEGLFDELEHFKELSCKAVENYDFADFLIGSRIDSDIQTHEEELWSTFGASHPEPIKSEFNRELGKLVGEQLGKWVNFNTPDMTIILDTRYDTISLQIASLFIYGRYKKLVRDIPQTRWPCKRCWGKGCKNCNGTGKIYQTSVEEEIASTVMDLTKGTAHFFHGMGREDITVRMLGNGRPFILEISEPINRTLDLIELQRKINQFASGKVEVSDLAITTHQAVRDLKAAKPDKTYSVKVNFPNKIKENNLKEIIESLKGATIKQRTPVRVSHRRSDLIRDRKIIEIELSKLIEHGTGAVIEIRGESGLYIKELITGDSGRTKPSLADKLGLDCEVEELDVLRINDGNDENINYKYEKDNAENPEKTIEIKNHNKY